MHHVPKHECLSLRGASPFSGERPRRRLGAPSRRLEPRKQPLECYEPQEVSAAATTPTIGRPKKTRSRLFVENAPIIGHIPLLVNAFQGSCRVRGEGGEWRCALRPEREGEGFPNTPRRMPAFRRVCADWLRSGGRNLVGCESGCSGSRRLRRPSAVVPSSASHAFCMACGVSDGCRRATAPGPVHRDCTHC